MRQRLNSMNVSNGTTAFSEMMEDPLSQLLFREPEWLVNFFRVGLVAAVLVNIGHAVMVSRLKFGKKNGGQHFRTYLIVVLTLDLIPTGKLKTN